MENKKLLFTLSKSKYLSHYQTWYSPFKEVLNQIVFFDTHYNRILHGKEKMNKMFLEFIEKERPDYIFMSFGPDEFKLSTFLKIRLISPKTKIFGGFGDDDLEFEKYSRYIMLFLDYALTHQRRLLKDYKKDGIKNVFGVTGLNIDNFKYLKLKKKYDVSFIGMPSTKKSERYNFIKYLKDNGISLALFGWGWEKYPELKEIYGGPISSEKIVEVINQSKINLCFSKNSYGEPHIKGKLFEGGACKTFILTDYCKDYLSLLREGKEIVMFKDKEDLLNKVNFFLKNKKEREKIANAAYKKIKEKYNLNVELKNIFKKIKNDKSVWKLPTINEKSYPLSVEELSNKERLSELLKDYKYVSFKTKHASNLEFKDYLQIYSLKVTKKPISCCNYYVNNKNLGDYLYFRTEKSFRDLSKKDFISFLNISQLVVSKKFFLDNVEKFEDAFHGKISFLNKENTAFADFPLVRVQRFSSKKYSAMKKAFVFEFIYQLYSLYSNKKIHFIKFAFSLLLEILSGKLFILRHLVDSIKNKSRLDRLKKLQEF